MAATKEAKQAPAGKDRAAASGKDQEATTGKDQETTTGKDRVAASGKGSAGEPGELFLIDGNSLAYRAFFALPESIATADGRPTNAIYGFASMMAKILIEHRPQAVIVAWDAGMSGRELPTSRTRPSVVPAPDLLSEQWPHLAPLAEAFGFHNVKVEGWEADDVIATLVRQAREAEIPVMVVSGDRDVYQVVADGVRVMTTSRGVTETKIYDREGVIERYGVPPELVPDLIGLKGDTSDNIPGVPGIGDKTAAQLLQEFGSLEAVLDNVDKISGAKRKQNLTEHADDARVSKQLATLNYDIEVPIDVRKEARAKPDRSRLREVAAEFELRQVIQRLDEEFPEDVPERAVEETLVVEAQEGTPADLRRRPDLDRGCGRALGGERRERRWSRERRRTWSSSPSELRDRPLIAHDVKSQGGGGRSGLLAVAPPGALQLEHDTMVAAYLIDPARRVYDLNELAADAGLAAAPGGRPTPGQMSLAAEEGEAAGDPAAEARLVAELAPRQRERLAEFGLERLLERGRDAADRGAGGLGAGRDQGRRQAAGGDRRGDGGADRRARARDLRARGPRVHDRLAAAARGGAVLRAGPDQEAPRQDRVLDRRPRARPDPRRARDRRQGRELARADQAQEHLPRRAARADRPRDRSHPHHLQPGRDDHRAPLEHQPEPPEHPDPLGDRAAGASAASWPSGATGCCPPTTTRWSFGCWRTSPNEDVLREIFASGDDVHRETAAEVLAISPGRGRPGGALEGEDGQLRDRLRAVRVRARRPPADLPRGGGGLHPALLRAIPGREAVHRRDDREGGARRVRVHAARPPPRDPRAALEPAPAPLCWASGWPSTP